MSNGFVLTGYGTTKVDKVEAEAVVDDRNIHSKDNYYTAKPALVLGVVSCTPKNSHEPSNGGYDEFAIDPEYAPPDYTEPPGPHVVSNEKRIESHGKDTAVPTVESCYCEAAVVPSNFEGSNPG